jgi:serine/threonine protein kinase
LEYCNGGTLKQLLDAKGGRLREEECWFLVKQITQGLVELFRENILHRDIKLENIMLHFPRQGSMKGESCDLQRFLKDVDLVKEGVIAKIIDFGVAKKMEHIDKDVNETFCGTPLQMAPQILEGEKYNYKSDIWSLGIVFFEMLVGFAPFTGKNMNELQYQIEQG